MKNVILVCAALLASFVCADMPDTPTVLPVIDCVNIDVSGVATVATISATSATLTSSSITTATVNTAVMTKERVVVASTSVTNTQPVTLSSSYNVLTPYGNTATYSNTPVFANAVDGQLYYIVCGTPLNTNVLRIADAGVMHLTADWVADIDDALILLGRGTNYVELGRNAN